MEMKLPRHRPPTQRRLPLPAASRSSSQTLRGSSSPRPQSPSDPITPPPDKPLPLLPARSSSTPPMTRSSTRSSSVYSSTSDFWGPPSPVKSENESIHADVFLQPSFYQSHSTSTPELAGPKQTDLVLEPRKYSPLIPSPSSSPTESKSSSPAPRPSILLPPPPSFPRTPSNWHHVAKLKSFKTVARAVLPSPEESTPFPLLPEEFRAVSKIKPRQSSAAPILQSSSLPRPMSVVNSSSIIDRSTRRNPSIPSIRIDEAEHATEERGRPRDRRRKSSSLDLRKRSRMKGAHKADRTPSPSSSPTRALTADKNYAFAEAGESIVDDIEEDAELLPAPLFTWGRNNFKKHTQQRSDGQITGVSAKATGQPSSGHSRRFGSLTGSGPLSTFMGSHRRRSTSGTIPISPPFAFDTGILADSNDLAATKSFLSPDSSKSIDRQTNVPYHFAFSPPATPQTEFTPGEKDPPPLKTPISHSAHSRTPKPTPQTIAPPSQAHTASEATIPNPGKPSPNSNLANKSAPSLSHSSPSSKYLLPPTSKPFSPLTPNEIALVSQGAAKWGDSLSGSAPHRPKRPIRLPRSTTAPSSAPPASHGASVAGSASAPRKKPGLAGLLGALEKGRGRERQKAVGTGAVVGVHHAHSMSAPVVGRERAGGRGGGDRSAEWIPRPAVKRYPTLASRSEAPRDLKDVPGMVERGAARGGMRLRPEAGMPPGEGGRAESPAASNPRGRRRNEEVARGAGNAVEPGLKQTREEKREEKRKQELKSSIRVVGTETWI
ncbi:hypothetical protein EV356DRAFT_566656 [Viridothelium virens]|uniref:Uncharacterized protein n=1 Tax=Viridothelium virens TaxID=1048519 RepID=A0A6A6HAB0_VIRVR|nr:hypothetical protein EV356DRAFT_566656 [Viridothelium virens]